MGDFKVGDTVRVAFESKVTFVHHDGYLTVGGNPEREGELVRPEHATKVEPPVVTFGPGDFVRRRTWRDTPGRLYYLGTDQYIRLHEEGGRLGTSCKYGTGYTQDFFNSEWFEKVELHEAPL